MNYTDMLYLTTVAVEAVEAVMAAVVVEVENNILDRDIKT